MPSAVDISPALVQAFADCAKHPTGLIPYAVILDTKKGLVPWEDWPHLRDLLDGWTRQDRSILLKSRQLGASWAIALYALWLAKFQPGANVLMLSQGEDEAADLLDKCRTLEGNFPAWLRYPRGKDNDSELEFPVMNSRIRALPSTEKAGRSNQGTLVVMDEFAFHKYAETSLSALLPAVSDAGQLIVVSTANGLGGPMYDLWDEAEERGFVPTFLPWSVRPDRTPDWYARQAKADPKKVKQEFPATAAEAFLQSASAVFTEGLDLTAWLVRIPTPDLIPPATIVYRHPHPDCTYLMGVDVAEGLEHGDRSCCVVLERDTLGRCVEAAHLCGTWPTDTWAEMVDLLACAYGALCGVERNNHGHAVLDHLRRFAADRLTRRERQPYTLFREQAPLKSPTSAGIASHSGEWGWNTTTASKPLMIDELEEGLRTGAVCFATPELQRELRSYQRDEKGRTGAPAGKHDDRVMSLAICWQMRKWAGVRAGYRTIKAVNMNLTAGRR